MLVAPVIGIERLAVTVPAMASVCVVLSEHAVSAITELKTSLGFVAIGSQTATALEQRGLGPVHVPDTHDSAGIIRWLDSNGGLLLDSPVLILTGEGGTARVETYLREKRISFVRCNAYRRIHLEVAASVVAAEVVVISSGDAVASIKKCLEKLRDWEKTPVVVPSARVSARAREAGFSHIVISAGASPDAVAYALRHV